MREEFSDPLVVDLKTGGATLCRTHFYCTSTSATASCEA
jgi:hypothetical protein